MSKATPFPAQAMSAAVAAAPAPAPAPLAAALVPALAPSAADTAAQASAEAAAQAAQAAQRAADAVADAAMNLNAVALRAADQAAAKAPPEPLTLDEAAALVRRRVVYTAAGAQDVVQLHPIHPREVLAFKDHGTHVVVVTIDGQKFSTADAA